jgi:hypothetical protein
METYRRISIANLFVTQRLTDFTDLWFYQINPLNGKVRYIHHYRSTGMTLDYYIDYIKDFQRKHRLTYLLNILPQDGNNKMMINALPKIGEYDRYNVATKRVDYLQSRGLRCFVMDRKVLGEDKWRIINRINTVRKEFDNFEIDETMCFAGVELLRGYIKTYNKTTGLYTDVPNHNANNNASDCADSFGIGVMYYVLFLKNGGGVERKRVGFNVHY